MAHRGIHRGTGGGEHRAQHRPCTPRRLRALPPPDPGAAHAAGPHHDPLHPAHGRRGPRLPRDPSLRWHDRRHHRRARVLQCRTRRAHRRQPLGASRWPTRRRRPHPRHRTRAHLHARHAAPAAPGDPRRCRSRLPLHLHVLRRGPRPGRPRPAHDRSRDLHRIHPATRPSRRRGARTPAIRHRGRGSHMVGAPAGACRRAPEAR